MSHRIIKNVREQNLGEQHLNVISLAKEEFRLVKNYYFDIEDLGGEGFYYLFHGLKFDKSESEIFIILKKNNPMDILTKLLLRYGFSITYNGMNQVYQVELQELGIRSGHLSSLKEAIRNFKFSFFLMLELMSNNLSQVS